MDQVTDQINKDLCETDGLFSKKKVGTIISVPDPDDEFYNTSNSKRGLALIFNHKEFNNSNWTTRYGTDVDRDAMDDLLVDLGFEVHVYNDLDVKSISYELNKVSQMDHSASDCLLIVVMSHGESNKIYAYDSWYPTNMLWNQFTAIRCPSLAGKPKLVFIQACRGSGMDPGIQVHHTKEETDSSSDSNVTYSLPVMADILVMYSTADGYYSYRNPVNGSFFIQTLVEQLRKFHEDKDLLSILTTVNRRVAVEFSTRFPSNSTRSNEYKQMCSIVTMLTRLFYLKTKKINIS